MDTIGYFKKYLLHITNANPNFVRYISFLKFPFSAIPLYSTIMYGLLNMFLKCIFLNEPNFRLTFLTFTMLFIHMLFKILIIHIANAKSIENLLTKKSSRLWLQNETRMANPANHYCSMCCINLNRQYQGRKCGIHTMCAYAKKKVGAACRGLIKMDFSQNEIDVIVDAHNTLRNRIAMGLEKDGDPGPQPEAANMRLMSWDAELATVASLWATQCVFSHDLCRDLDRFPVGQNIAKGSYASKSDLEHIANWYELVEFSSKKSLESYDQKKHQILAPFTQLVWADTYLVGCARVTFQESVNGQILYTEHFFCNYGPSGNIPHQPVYKFGEACSACYEGTFCINPEYPGLCCNEVLNETYLTSERKRRRNKQLENNESVKLKSFCFHSVFSLSVFLLIFYDVCVFT